MKISLTQLDSTLMAHALQVAALTDQSRSGISAVRDYYSIMMLTKSLSIKLLSIPMVDIFFQPQMTQL
jgi:hypothetical protein